MAKWSYIKVIICVAIVLGLGGCESLNDSPLAATDPIFAVSICPPSEYDLTCLKDDKTSTSDGILEVLTGIKKEVVGMSSRVITDERQDEYGDVSHQQITREYPLMPNHPKLDLLKGLMGKLLRLRPTPTQIKYNIYVIRSEMINAFTVGGEIYVTNAMLDDVKSLDELACIIGHEIGHNELGQIRDQLKQLEDTQELLGEEAGTALYGIINFVSMGFNQTNEAECDLFGIDLALAAGYDPCRGIDFWNRLGKGEGDADEWENFFRSHPYSSKRANCYRSHIANYHHMTCSN